MKIIVVASNRSSKLLRTLQFYQSPSFDSSTEVVVLDASSDRSEQGIIQDYCDDNNIQYFHKPVQFSDRIIQYCQTLKPHEIIAISPDEDIYFPDFLDTARKFLENNPDYSSFIGRYATFQKPLGPFNRVSYTRDTILDYNIFDERPLVRASKLFGCLLAGCSPVFWGVRTAGNYLESCHFQKKCIEGASMEVADQIILAMQGKIKFSSVLMMLRDETKIGHKHSSAHHDLDVYITLNELEVLKTSANAVNYDDIGSAVDLWCSFYDYSTENPKSIAKNWYGGNYQKYKPFTKTKIEKSIIDVRFFNFRLFTMLYEMLTAIIFVKSLKKKYGRNTISSVIKKISLDLN